MNLECVTADKISTLLILFIKYIGVCYTTFNQEYIYELILLAKELYIFPRHITFYHY